MLITWQSFAAVSSLISTLSIINVWGIDDSEVLGALIISFAVLQWICNCMKLGAAIDEDDFDGSAYNMVIIGAVDAAFDIIVGIAYINTITEVHSVYNCRHNMFTNYKGN